MPTIRPLSHLALLFGIAVSLTGSGCEVTSHSSQRKVETTTSTYANASSIKSNVTSSDQAVSDNGSFKRETTTTSSTVTRTLPDGTQVIETEESKTVRQSPPGGGEPVLVKNESTSGKTKRVVPPAKSGPILE